MAKPTVKPDHYENDVLANREIDGDEHDAALRASLNALEATYGPAITAGFTANMCMEDQLRLAIQDRLSSFMAGEHPWILSDWVALWSDLEHRALLQTMAHGLTLRQAIHDELERLVPGQQ